MGLYGSLWVSLCHLWVSMCHLCVSMGLYVLHIRLYGSLWVSMCHLWVAVGQGLRGRGVFGARALRDGEAAAALPVVPITYGALWGALWHCWGAVGLCVALMGLCVALMGLYGALCVTYGSL